MSQPKISGDSVRAYLRDIGRIPLLEHDGAVRFPLWRIDGTSFAERLPPERVNVVEAQLSAIAAAVVDHSSRHEVQKMLR